MNTKAKITSKGQITLPAKLRRQLGLRTGDVVEFRLTSTGRVEMLAQTWSLADLRGLIKLDEPIGKDQIDDWLREARATRAAKALP